MDEPELEERLDELTAERDELRAQQREREQTADRIESLESDLEQREAENDRRGDELADLENEKESLEEEVAELRSTSDDEMLGLHAEASSLEFEIGQLTRELETLEDDIDRLEDVAAEDEVRARREEITDLRTCIERLERDVIEEFNRRADELLEILEYDNIERLWLERREREVHEGRQTVTRSTFDFHIVRQTNDGTTYEDSVGHLSESEREIAGLLFALASYLVHEVYKDVPFMLLDSLEAIDAPRINELIQYIDDIAPNVVVALLPEDAAALPAEYHRVGLRGRRGRSRPVDRDTRPKRFVRRYTDTSS